MILPLLSILRVSFVKCPSVRYHLWTWSGWNLNSLHQTNWQSGERRHWKRFHLLYIYTCIQSYIYLYGIECYMYLYNSSKQSNTIQLLKQSFFKEKLAYNRIIFYLSRILTRLLSKKRKQGAAGKPSGRSLTKERWRLKQRKQKQLRYAFCITNTLCCDSVMSVVLH